MLPPMPWLTGITTVSGVVQDKLVRQDESWYS
jgi:hypothetical protein